jgi:hypothetical protein
MVICLIGYLSTGTPGWPPPYEDARSERLEGLATIIRILDVNESQYERFVELTRKLLADEHFIRLRDAIARALTAVPRLEREDIEALCKATGTPIPTGKQEEPCST